MKVEFKARPWQRKQNIWFGDYVFPRDSWEIRHRAGNVRCWEVFPKSEFSLNIGRAISHLGHWHITSSGKLDLWASITLWHGIKSDFFMSEGFWITWRDYENTEDWPNPQSFWKSRFGWGLKFCFSNMFLHAADAAHLRTLLCKLLFCSVQ